jgi:benzoyl-CoA reductase/2-hydroxyglutaryl-CoA dehydratase subunit BcrC/BadD/HgdB
MTLALDILKRHRDEALKAWDRMHEVGCRDAARCFNAMAANLSAVIAEIEAAQTASQSSRDASTDTKTASDLLSDGQHD